jgi:hypothetical protein
MMNTEHGITSTVKILGARGRLLMSQVAISVAKDGADDPASAEHRAKQVKDFVKDTYGFEPLSETSAYITYLISRSNEESLPAMLKNLERNSEALGISDLQVCFFKPRQEPPPTNDCSS